MAYSRFHSSRQWKRTRAIARHSANFTCERCGAYLPGKGELHIHHKMKVRDHPAVALEWANFQCLCAACHDAIEPRAGGPPRSGCDERGWPLGDHPWNK
jgi:5-methylcytosine-specific restriction endonuclease McrA